MNEPLYPTKGNLLLVKKYLALSNTGFELLDRKRSILIRELMLRLAAVKELEREVSETFRDAYKALEQANITLGVIERIAQEVPVDDSVQIRYRSVMGVELPTVTVEPRPPRLCYGLGTTNSKLDYAFFCFARARELSARLAEVENSVYRLTNAIRKAQRRANSLKNIIIPGFEQSEKFIAESLEEKEREEFSRLKVIKRQRQGPAGERR